MVSVDDLWLVDFGVPYPGEPAARRPALVIGPPEAFGPVFPFIILVPLTSTRRGLSLHVEVEASAATGLERTSYVQCELLRSVNRNRLVHHLGAIDAATSRKVAVVIGTLLGR
ncbi:MAG: type II toxin-antitoxin system PemK/MazF family toxin [Actinobacteria bacterium]|nr:type II toxin-antitoxin system PemK/MazF family toxin [Actinomycetota bacterium]